MSYLLPSISVVLLATLGLGFYTVRKMNPGWFRVRTSMGRVFTFDVEIGSAGMTEKPEVTASRP